MLRFEMIKAVCSWLFCDSSQNLSKIQCFKLKHSVGCSLNKVKVLVIAPYEGMKDVIASIAAARDDIEVTILVGNMERGAALVEVCDQSRYDVIVSRGGTARLIREVTSFPLIEIELTPYDIRNALSQVSGDCRNYAVAGFPSIVEATSTLCELLEISIPSYIIHDDAEARRILPQLKAEGVELILCDMVGMEAAPASGLETVLITSGVKGLEAALNKAVAYFSSANRAKLAAAVFEAELGAQGESLVVLNAAGQILYSAPEPTVPPPLRKLFSRMLPSVLSDGQLAASRPAGSKEYAISANSILCEGEPCAVFRFRSRGYRLPVSTPGVRYYDSSEEDMRRVSRHYGTPDSCQIERAEKISQSGLPVVVFGEKGTLPRAMAGYICMNSLLSERDCCVIDCSAVGVKGWAKLMGQSGFLAFRSGSTLLFDRVLDMPDRDLESLVDFLRATDLSRQLRLVFVISTGVYPQREETVIRLLSEQLYCVTMRLPPLRERSVALPSVLESCFTSICADMGVRVPVVEEAGWAQLLAYDWPRNYPQLYRVLTQLVADCRGGEITAGQVEAVLREEKTRIVLHPNRHGEIDLSGTLEDIDYRVVMQILAEEGMNRSRTAKRLGISRATLWRILGRDSK